MMDLQPEMQDILRRNGMQAHVVSDGTGHAGEHRETAQQEAYRFE